MIVRAANIEKSIGTQVVFSGLSFAIGRGEKVGLVGPNGSGKTTLLRMLLREIEPDDGDLLVSADAEIGYMRQDVLPDEKLTIGGTLLGEMTELERRLADARAELALDPDDDAAMVKLEVLEEELDQRFGSDYRSRAERALSRLGFGVERFSTPVAKLSPGERARLELARVTVGRPDFLILDEPTNFLDIRQREWLESFLETFAGTVLVVSHDRSFLNNTVNRVLDLRRGHIRDYEGNYDDYERQRTAEREQQAAEHALQTKEIRKLETVARDRRTWSARREATKTSGDSGFESHRAAKMAKRAKHAETRIEQMIERHRADKPFIEKTPHPVLVTRELPDKRALLVKGVVKSFDRRTVLGGVGFEMGTHERVALVGPNGCGKTVLLRIIMGELEPDRGEAKLGADVRPGYFPQDLVTLDLGCTAVAEVRKSGCSEETARTVLGTLLLPQAFAVRKLGELSAGERSKALLGRILAGGADLLILDEPTNHLDIDALIALEGLLLQFPGAVLFASHDRAMLERLAGRVLELADGRLTDFHGGYRQYREKSQVPSHKFQANPKTQTNLKLQATSPKQVPSPKPQARSPKQAPRRKGR